MCIEGSFDLRFEYLQVPEVTGSFTARVCH
jgi:hypothetical protein